MKSMLKAFSNKTPVSYTPRRSGGTSSFTNPNSLETYMRAYQVSGAVYSNVTLMAESVASSEWRLFRKATDGRVRYTTADFGTDNRVEVIQHQALNVLNNPNPFYTCFDLFEMSQTWLELTGECWWIIDRDNPARIPVGIWPVRPDRMEPIPDPVNYLSGYFYRPPDGSEPVPFRTDEIIFVKTPNPLNPYRGQGAIQTVLSDVEANRYQSDWNRNFFLNEAEPGGVIQVPNHMSDDQFNEFQDRWRETHRGVSRAHRVGMLESGMTWVPNDRSQKDMDFVNLRTNSRDNVHESMRTNKVMLGIADDVNRANAQTGQEVFAYWQLTPRLRRWKVSLNKQFLYMFGTTGSGVEFDFTPPSPKNIEQSIAELAAKSLAVLNLKNAGYDAHDVLKEVGLEDMRTAEETGTAKPAPVIQPPATQPNSGDNNENA